MPLMRLDKARLVDLLAGDPRVRVLSDFRATTGCLIIACPLAPATDGGHRCAVMGPAAGAAAGIACIHPGCWHLSTEDFLEHLGLAGRVLEGWVREEIRPSLTRARPGFDSNLPLAMAADRAALKSSLATAP